jgi:hypothetical protein
MATRLLLLATLLGGSLVSKAENRDFLSLPDTLNPPACVASPDVSVLCDQFDPSLLAYPGIESQSSSVVSVSVLLDYSLFDTICLRGRIARTFVVYDSTGASGSCTQHIDVAYQQDYFIRFPNDVIVTSCNGAGGYGQPVFYGEDCELLAASSEDEVSSVVPDACFRIQRHWTIINWCTFDPALPLIEVPNPTPSAVANHPSNLPGPTVSSIQTAGDPWRSTIVKLSPTDPSPTNFSVYYDSNANGYKYTQLIKIVDMQDPDVVAAPVGEQPVNDLTVNDAQLWNELYWWDDVNGIHDLSEAEADISIQATDACSDVNIGFQLFLDLNGDGVMETRLDSDELGAAGLGWNAVPFGNVTGTAQIRQFDERPVAAADKWGFAIEQTKSGSLTTARLRFNTASAPATYVSPQLPHGIHKIKWFVGDQCGNETVREYTIAVRDRKEPTVVCLNNLSANIMPTGQIQMWASDFLAYAEDNCTTTAGLAYGIRKAGAGSGFPVDGNGNPVAKVVFDCSELGNQSIELWSIDKAGNADFCQANLILQDNMNNCNPGYSDLGGDIYSVGGDQLQDVVIRLNITTPFLPPISYFDVVDGHYDLPFATPILPISDSVRIYPEKDDDPLNGVSTYDLILIKNYIDGTQPLTPYQMIAADANLSGTITSFDILELRKLILGIYNELPNNSSWRFIPANYEFPKPNPFKFPYPESVSVAEIRNFKNGGDFIGVKVGDINGSAVPMNTAGSEAREADPVKLHVRTDNEANGDLLVHIGCGQAVSGCQFELLLDGLQCLDAVPEGDMTAGNIVISAEGNGIAVSTETGGDVGFTLRCRQTRQGSLPEQLTLNGRNMHPETYTGAQIHELVLSFPDITGFELYQNQPNPFEAGTRIPFNMEADGEATLRVFDINGKQLLTRTGACAKGMNYFTADGLPSGVMYYELETGENKAVRKMIRL